MARIEPIDRADATARARELLDETDIALGVHPSTIARSAA